MLEICPQTVWYQLRKCAFLVIAPLLHEKVASFALEGSTPISIFIFIPVSSLWKCLTDFDHSKETTVSKTSYWMSAYGDLDRIKLLWAGAFCPAIKQQNARGLGFLQTRELIPWDHFVLMSIMTTSWFKNKEGLYIAC